MSKERKRKRADIVSKGIPIAELGASVIWDDPKLKVPFTSHPFISRMLGNAQLNMVLSYGLYYNELTQKWTPITATTMTEALSKARYYPTPPDALTELSDNPMRSTDSQELMVNDTDLLAKLELVRIINNAIKTQTDKLQFDGSNNLKCVYAL